MGSMGQMSSSTAATGQMDDGWAGQDDDMDATPLLQELEIYPDHIREKTLEVLNPARPIKDEYLQDADLAGPLVFCLVLGVCLLFVSLLLLAKAPLVTRLPPHLLFAGRKSTFWLHLQLRPHGLRRTVDGAEFDVLKRP